MHLGIIEDLDTKHRHQTETLFDSMMPEPQKTIFNVFRVLMCFLLKKMCRVINMSAVKLCCSLQVLTEIKPSWPWQCDWISKLLYMAEMKQLRKVPHSLIYTWLAVDISVTWWHIIQQWYDLVLAAVKSRYANILHYALQQTRVKT